MNARARLAVSGEVELGHMKTLGPTAARTCFHAPQTHESRERLRTEPGLGTLTRITGKKSARLGRGLSPCELHVGVGGGEPALVLRYLILEDQVGGKCWPGHLADHAMGLVQVGAMVREHDVGCG